MSRRRGRAGRRAAGFFARHARALQRSSCSEAERARHQTADRRAQRRFSAACSSAIDALDRRARRRAAAAVAPAHAPTTATLHAPDRSADAPRPTRSCAPGCKRDADRHLRSARRCTPLALIAVGAGRARPGPNVLGYFFTFTVVGHFLAWRGARRGLHEVRVDGRAERRR